MESGKKPAQNNHMETTARTFILPSRQNQFTQETKFNKFPIREIAVARNTVSAFAGSIHQNPFLNQQFHLRALKVIRVGRAIVFLDTTFPFCP